MDLSFKVETLLDTEKLLSWVELGNTLPMDSACHPLDPVTTVGHTIQNPHPKPDPNWHPPGLPDVPLPVHHQAAHGELLTSSSRGVPVVATDGVHEVPIGLLIPADLALSLKG